MSPVGRERLLLAGTTGSQASQEATERGQDLNLRPLGYERSLAMSDPVWQHMCPVNTLRQDVTAVYVSQ
jgi:hypothetical protein